MRNPNGMSIEDEDLLEEALEEQAKERALPPVAGSRDATARFVDSKMIKDPNYAPYCMRCPGAVRMKRTGEREARCHCGASHIIPENEQTQP